MALRCVIVDDNPSFLDAATLLEREGLAVVGVASSADEAVRQTQLLLPDVVLVDIMLGSQSGFDLARRMADTETRPPTVILISTHSGGDFADLIAETPAAGFLPKSELSAGAIQRLVVAP